MKYLVIIVLSFSLSNCSVLKKNNTRYKDQKTLKIPTKEEFDTIVIETFQLKSIDTITYKFNNVFYVKKDNYLYKIVSKKEKLNPCERLIINEFYKLKIPIDRKSFFMRSGLISGRVMYESEPVMLELNDSVKWDLFVTPYIRGTCYIGD